MNGLSDERMARLADKVDSGHEILSEHVENQRIWNQRHYEEIARLHARIDERHVHSEQIASQVAQHAHDIELLQAAESHRVANATRIKNSAMGAMGAGVLAMFAWALTQVPESWMFWK